jgi:MOSC domain-containing protein YiiM
VVTLSKRFDLPRATVVQINVSNGGVPKTPISRAEVGELGIAGDRHRYPRHHGGPRKALLLIASEVVDQLRREGWPVFYGALGENITTAGLDHRSWRPGARYRIGPVLIELTTPREPCRALRPYGSGIQKRLYDGNVRALDPSSPHWGESGFYVSVLETGAIAAGDIIECIEKS